MSLCELLLRMVFTSQSCQRLQGNTGCEGTIQCYRPGPSLGFLQQQPNCFSPFSTEQALVVAHVGIPHPFTILKKLAWAPRKSQTKDDETGCQGSSWHHKHSESSAGTPPSMGCQMLWVGGPGTAVGKQTQGRRGGHPITCLWNNRTPLENPSCRSPPSSSAHPKLYTLGKWPRSFGMKQPGNVSIVLVLNILLNTIIL